MPARAFGRLAVFAAALIAVGCATNPTSINAQWASPSIASAARVQDVLVIAALRDTTQRRMLEDRMVEALGAAGVKAAPSHRFLGEAAQVSEEQLQQAVTAAGASHVLISSISGMTTDVRVTPGMVTGPGWGPGWSRGPAMGPSWGGMTRYYNSAWARSTPPEVRTTQNTHGDTRLFDVASSEVVWSVATTTVTNRGNVPTLIDGFVRRIVDTLKKDSLI
ncbi:MAG: hypothetical protein FIB04_10740 [Gammaproteobacteria bacterium]|nr:hypothetical protein [Gammaproteobacteria bacterium]